MTLRPSENILAFLLVASFVAVGCCVTRRVPVSIREINEFFLAGLSLCAIILFPATLLVPHHAVLSCVLLLAAADVIAIHKYLPTWAPALADLQKRSETVTGLPRLIGYVGLVVMVLAVGQFVIQNLRFSYFWDGYQTWSSKAQLLFYKGGLSKDMYLPGGYSRTTEYPPLVPLWESLITSIRGEFEWNSAKVIFPYFFVSSLVSTYYLTRVLASRTVAMWAAACLAIVPSFATTFSIGGYADMPQGCLLVGAVSAFTNFDYPQARFRTVAPWILSGVFMVKSEGSILFFIFAAITLLFFGVGRSRLERHWDFIAIVLSAYFLRVLYVLWCGQRDPYFGPLDQDHLIRAWHIGFQIPVEAAKHLRARLEWGLLWPAFFASAFYLLVFGGRPHRALSLGGLSALSVYTLIFYFANAGASPEKDWRRFMQVSYHRLLTQVAPIAITVCAAAVFECGRRLRATTSAPEVRGSPVSVESTEVPR